MKIKTHNLVSLALALVFFFNTVYSKASSQEDFITIYTTVFHPGPSVDATKTVEWDFNGDGVIDSTQLDGSYVFPGPGTYSVKLKVKDSLSESITTKTISISESLVPTGPVIPANWMNTAWSNRIKITIKAAKIAGDLSDFPVYLNLGILPSEFFTTVQTSGADIRITKIDGKTELAREIVSVDKVNRTGELHFKADTLKAGVDNEFYIYFGNQAATEIGGQNVWTNGYVGVWHVTNSNEMIDSTGHGLSLKAANIDKQGLSTASKLGTGMKFDGINDTHQVADNGLLDLTNVTITFWTKFKTVNGNSNLVGRGGGGSSPWKVRTSGSNIFFQGYTDSANPTSPALVVGTDIMANDSTWYKLDFSYSAIDGGRSYLNGLQKGSGNQPNGSLTMSRNDSLDIAYSDVNSSYMEMTLDEIRISSVVRPLSWLTTEYSNQNDNSGFFTVNANETILATPIGTEKPIPANWMNTAWSNRIKITIKAAKITGDLTDFPVYLNLGILPSEFFDKVQTSGADIRITKIDGKTELAREIVSVDKVNRTGELHFKVDALKAGVDNEFYIYYGNQAATEIGGQNVWTNYTAVYHMKQDPSGGAPQMTDSCSGAYHMTASGSLTSGDSVTGKIGKGVDLDYGESDKLQNTSMPPTANQGTVTYWCNLKDTAARYAVVTVGNGSSGTSYRSLLYDKLSFIQNGAGGAGKSNAAPPLDTWFYYGGRYNRLSTPNLMLTLNSSNYTSNATLGTSITNGITVGAGEWNVGAILDEIRYSTQLLTDNYLLTEYNNQNDNSGFFTISANETITTTSSSTEKPIPSNWMNKAWTNRTKVTIKSGKVTENLVDFPVYVKLTDLGDGFFTSVNANCGDIRVTDSTGITELPREVVSCNPTNKTGELHFKASLLNATSENLFYIYYGNPTATNYDNTATYGRNKVWTSDFELVAHFEENPTTSAFMNSTGGVSGTYANLGGLATSGGSVGNSLDCSATSPIGYVDLDTFSTNPNRNFAFSAFVNFSSTTTPQVFFEYASPGGLNTRRVAAMFTSGKINWNHNNYDGNIETNLTMSTGSWYHMSLNSLEEDTAHSKVNTWMNGVDNTVRTGYDSDNITANLGVICANRLFGESYNGKIDELRFYKAFKSNAWLLSEDSNLRSPNTFYEVGAKESL